MKTIMLLVMLGLVGCAGSQPAVFNSHWSDYNHETMMDCGEAAQFVADLRAEGDPAVADWLYNKCLFDQGVTI